MADYYRELTEFLRENGCRFVRQAKGSHEFWESPLSAHRFAVPTKIKSRQTANEILKQAGLHKRF